MSRTGCFLKLGEKPMSGWGVRCQQAATHRSLASGFVALAVSLAALPASAQVPATKPLPDTEPPVNPASAWAPKSAYTLGTPEIKIMYRLQRDKQTGVVNLASAVPSPKTIAIAWEPAFGAMPENPILVQVTFHLNVHNAKVPGTFTTTAPVAPQNGQWSADLTDVVNKLIAEINSTLSPNYDPYTMSFPLDTEATVRAIPIQKSPAQVGPLAIVKGPTTDVNKGQLKVARVLTFGDPDSP